MKWQTRIEDLISSHPNSYLNPDRARLIQDAVDRWEAILSNNGALATWTPPESTGRSP
ncbi:MAG TPA: hypothetical protein VGB30_06430 [bacterium]|jgi:phosphoenolpyruvate carboxykinase (ATP)